MMTFAQRCGLQNAAREQALARFREQLATLDLDLVRFAWCDLHGVTHVKTLAAGAGYGMQCGLEVELHIYRIEDDAPRANPALADWPGQPPAVSMIHPGYSLLSEAWADMADEPLRIVQHTAQALGLPLLSLEVELGPSQIEAVFEVTDALTAADNMVLFRNGVRQALQRAGYHATFMCRPPFPNIMSSGWHLHQSLVDLRSGQNLFERESPAPSDCRCRSMTRSMPCRPTR